VSPTQPLEEHDSEYIKRLASSISGPGSNPLDENEIEALLRGHKAEEKTLLSSSRSTRGRQVALLASLESSDIDVFLDGLPVPSAPPDPPVEPVLTNTSQPTYSGDNACVTNSYHAGVSALDLAALAPHSDVLWPGSIVSGDSLYSGLLTPIPLKRGRGEVTLINPALTAHAQGPVTASIKEPTLDSVTAAVTDLLRANVGPAGVPAFSGGITIETYRSVEEAAMHLDAGASWLSGNVRNILDITSSSKRTNVVIRLVQGYYDLVFTPPATPSAMFNQGWFIGVGEVSLDDVKEALGPTPVKPAYVSTVRYGKMLLIRATSDAEEKTLSDVLHLAISGVSSSGQVDGALRQNAALQQTTFEMVVLGGGQDSATVVMGGFDALGHIADVWKDGATLHADWPAYPVSYQLRWLGRNPITGNRYDSARLTFTSDYSTTVCQPQKVVRFGARFQTTGDDKDGGDRVDIDLLIGGQLVASYWCDQPYNHKWDNNTSQPQDNDADFGGMPGWYSTTSFTRPVYSNEVGAMQLRVRKSGTDGWSFKPSSSVWLEGGRRVEFVQFPGGSTHFEDDNESHLFPE